MKIKPILMTGVGVLTGFAMLKLARQFNVPFVKDL
jgi:hypothetical protein